MENYRSSFKISSDEEKENMFQDCQKPKASESLKSCKDLNDRSRQRQIRRGGSINDRVANLIGIIQQSQMAIDKGVTTMVVHVVRQHSVVGKVQTIYIIE